MSLVIFEISPNWGPSSNQQSVTGAGRKDRLIKLCSGALETSSRCHFFKLSDGKLKVKKAVSYTHLRAHEDATLSRMPSSA